MSDSTPTYTVDHTTDEFGQDRWFVADKNGDWVAGPFDSQELAHETADCMADQS